MFLHYRYRNAMANQRGGNAFPAQGDLNQHLVEVSVKTQLKLYIGILSIYDYDYITSSKKKKGGFVCFVSCFVLFVFWFCFCIGCRLSIIKQHVNSNEGFSCLASCYKYSPIIHGKYDYYFPINKLRLHYTPNASHSMHTSNVPPHAHISSGPPDVAHPVVHLGHISRCMRIWHPVVHWWATSGQPDVKVACVRGKYYADACVTLNARSAPVAFASRRVSHVVFLVSLVLEQTSKDCI